MKKIIDNQLSRSLSKSKWYNPNSYTPLDSAVCFLIVIIVFSILSNFGGMFFRYLWRNKIITDYYLLSSLSLILTQGVIILIALSFSKIRKVNMFSGGGYRYSFNLIDSLFGVMLIIGLATVLYSTHYQFVDDIYYVAYGQSFDEYNKVLQESIPQGNMLILLIYELILVPIAPMFCEEALFRGIIMRGFERIGVLFAIILSSAMFAIMHGSFQQLVLQFFGGLAIASITYITRNYLLGAIMHFANNFFVIIIQVYGVVLGEMFENGSHLFNAFTIIYGSIFLVVSFIYFAKKYLKQYKNRTLGNSNNLFHKKVYSCISDTQDDCQTHEVIEFNEINYEQLYNNPSKMFLKGHSFRGFNNKRIKPLEIVIIVVGVLYAVVSIFKAL